jgi:glycine/D-amino acid oxidase-like deaminating enzyme
MEKVDCLIVGQGIAGSFLSQQFLNEGYRIKVIDCGIKNSSSWVAAGVINPLVLKRYTLSWRAAEFLLVLPSFYQGVYARLSKNYYHSEPLYKLISSKDESNFWQHRYEKAQLESYLEKNLLPDDKHLGFSGLKVFKKGLVKNCAWFDLKGFLSHFRLFLKQNEILLEEEFDFNALKKNNYKDLEFDQLVFCEGHGVKNNPFFSDLPFQWNKGELITIKATELKLKRMVKKKVFILPIGNDEYKVGATYSRDWNNKETSKEKLELLKAFLEEIIDVPYSIIKQEAGIRPAVKDRRPLMGKDEKSGYFLFNGLGSRGCFMAPLLSKEMLQFMKGEQALHPEANLNRYR